MRKISAILNISMDGVIQAPGRSDEDTRDGFDRGGWAVPYNDEVMAQRMAEGMSSSGAMLFGRRTYQDFYGYWPRQVDNPFTPYLSESGEQVRHLKHALRAAAVGELDPASWRSGG